MLEDSLKKAFEQAYRKWALPLTKFIVKRAGGNQEVVDEVFSQTITAAFKSYKTFKHKSSFFTWICKIALYKMADYYREQINDRSTFITPLFQNISQYGESKLSVTEKLALEELKQGVKDCLNLLPPNKRKLLHLKYWLELSHNEIAGLLGISERAVEGRLYRARRDLSHVISASRPELLEEKQLRH